MTLTVTHAKVTSGTANPNVEVDLAAWNANHALSGAADATQLNGNVVQAVTNDTNITGSIAAQNLTFSWSGTLAPVRGGLGLDASASSGVPIWTTGIPTFTATTGSGNVVRATSPTLVAPALGTPASGVLTNCTGLVNSLNSKAGAISLTVTKQVFTASGTYTPTANMVYCIIECVGGGGGGAGATVAAATTGQYGGGGGTSGGLSRTYASAATIGSSQTVTIGAAGSGGSAGANNGADGGATSVGTLCVANGGKGGKYGSVSQFGVGGAVAAAGTGDIAASGSGAGCGPYATTSPNTNSYMQSGFGGSSPFGGGGAAVLNGLGGGGAGNGNAGGGYGAGGSGGIVQSQNTSNGIFNAAGGNGTAGVVVITEFTVG